MRWNPGLTAAILALSVGLAAHSPVGEAADGPQYQPSKSCKKCHFKQFKSWQKTSMAQAFESLRPGVKPEAKVAAGLDPNKDYTEDATCLPCHTTGYGAPGGFVSIEETPLLAGVGCDSCHGPSEAYLEIMTTDYKNHPIKEMTDLGMIYPPKAEQCVGCHNDESSFNASVDPKYAFDFAERVQDDEGAHVHAALKADHPDLGSLDVLFR